MSTLVEAPPSERVRALARLCGEIQDVDDALYVRANVVVEASREQVQAKSARTPVLKQLEAAALILGRTGVEISVANGAQLAGQYLSAAAELLEASDAAS